MMGLVSEGWTGARVEMASNFNQLEAEPSIRPKIFFKTARVIPCDDTTPPIDRIIFHTTSNLPTDKIQKLLRRSTLFHKKCSPQKANPSPLSDEPSLLTVVCIEGKEEKVGMLLMMCLRGLT